ncbi:rho GDP dissociation inhibitor [Aspergillus niger]
MPEHEEDLVASQTEGFKVGEKKTIEEYQNLDKNDESLNRWKASLGLATGNPIGDPNDPRKCIIKSLALEVQGRPDVVIDLSTPHALETLKDKPFTIKEGATFHIKVVFQVHHEVLSGLKYLQVVKRKGIRVSKDEEMLVSTLISTIAGCKPCTHSLIGKLRSQHHRQARLREEVQRRGSPLRHDVPWPLQRRVQVRRR